MRRQILNPLVMYSVVATLALSVLVIMNVLVGAPVESNRTLLVITNALFVGVILVMAMNIVWEVRERV